MSTNRLVSLKLALIMSNVIALFAALPLVAAERERGTPVLAELFTSEGCSSCPPADALLAKLDRQLLPGVTVIVLSEHVDYWNRIGWTDPFSSPQASARQASYARKFGLDSSYTPQLVIDGYDQFVGSDARAIQGTLMRSAANPKLPFHIASAEQDRGNITIHLQMDRLPESSSFKTGEIWIALAAKHETSEVMRGENSGRTLDHVAVVRSLSKVGVATGRDEFTQTVRLPYEGRGTDMRIIAFVQQPGFGKVLGADMLELPGSR